MELKPHDPVTRPAHYTSHPSGVECITITRHMGFNLGNAIKYIWRADAKGAAIEDLRKAAFYIVDEIAKREARHQIAPAAPVQAAPVAPAPAGGLHWPVGARRG